MLAVTPVPAGPAFTPVPVSTVPAAPAPVVLVAGGVVVVAGDALTHHQMPKITRMTTIMPITQPHVLLLRSMSIETLLSNGTTVAAAA